LNHPVKLFFDNCLSKKLPKVLQSVYGEDQPELQVKHLTDFFLADDQDEDWLPLLEEDRGWIVVTADRGKDPKKEKLPVLCTQLQITHVSMTSAVHAAGYVAHRHAFLSLFPQFCCLGYLPKGTRVVLGFRTFHQRNWPCLLVSGEALDSWCRKNQINLPGLVPIAN